MLQLWLLGLDDPRLAGMEAQACDWLEESDRALMRQRKGDAARRFLFGRWLMRRALGKLSGLSPQELVFTLAPNGRPECEAARERGLVFNLSHAGNRLVVAVARAAAIGVDVEERRRAAQALRIARTFFSEPEQHNLAGLPEEQAQAAALRLWTVRESLVKAVDGTVWDGMKGVSLDPGGSRMALDGLKRRAANAEGWQAAAGLLGASHCLALAVGGCETDWLRYPVPVVDPLEGTPRDHWMPELVWQA